MRPNPGLTETLANPDAEHVELQQPIVDALAVLQVHEQMVDEAAAPRCNGTDQMTPRQKAIVFLPWHHCRHCCEDVDNWNAFWVAGGAHEGGGGGG